VTLEGSVTPLLSDQSMVEIIARHVSEDKRLLELAKDEAIDLARETRLATHGLLRAASEASLAMNMLTRGQLRLNMDVAGTDDPLADFSHAADRLTMGIVIAGLFIGSSIIYYSGIKPLLFGVPVVGFVGFFVAFVLGLRLVVDIMHENRRHR
jgi:ubiquinone biosynthesis protein